MLNFACVIFAVVHVGSINGWAQQKICKVPKGDAGKCISLQECQPLLDIYNNPKITSSELQYLRQSTGACGQGRIHKVCCPPKIQWQTLNINPVEYPAIDMYTRAYPDDVQNPDRTVTVKTIDNQSDVSDTPRKIAFKFEKKLGYLHNTSIKTTEFNKCGASSANSRIVGGSVTQIDDYPWLALLEYKQDELSCGGSLITDRFVLTAAHCLTGVNGIPSNVRLSEYNLTSGRVDRVEMDGGGFEEITVTVVRVALGIPHPNGGKNDIGLIKLTEKVQFSDFIKPICLPTRDLRSEFTASTKFILAGWGSDNEYVNTPVKMDVLVPYAAAPDKCATSAGAVAGRYICAGGEHNKDSCSGDSGGPLMYTADVFTVVGVVSRGHSVCGTKGATAEYTYVYTYLNWINATMEVYK